MKLTREQIAAVIPGGVPTTDQAAMLVSDLVTLAGEAPEADPEAMHDTLVLAARAIFAMTLLIES